MYYRRSLGNAFPPVSRSCAGSNGKVVKRRVRHVPLPDHFKELKKLIFLLCAYHYTYSKGDEGKHWKNNSLSSPKSPEKAMAPHSSTLAWKLPWMEEPGGLQSMGSLRVGHDWTTSLSLFIFVHWRGKWQRTPVFLPGESQGQRSLVGGCLWGRTESNTTETT